MDMPRSEVRDLRFDQFSVTKGGNAARLFGLDPRPVKKIP
jgi:hypothetical protein